MFSFLFSFFKKSFFAAFLFISPLSCHQKHTPKTCVLAFDMHNVFMIEGSPSLLRKLFFNEPYFMMDTIQLIQKLKRLGYPLYVLTNCRKEAYDFLTLRYPKIFKLFDGAYMPSRANGYSHKPNISFYQEFKNYLSSQGQDGKQIIFIDDLASNIRAARSEGIIGIQFKSLAQVEKELFGQIK